MTFLKSLVETNPLMNMATPLSTGSWPDFRQKVRKNFGQNFEFFAFLVKYRRFATIKWNWYTENAKKKRFWLIFRGWKFENFWKFRHRYTKMLPSGKFWFSRVRIRGWNIDLFDLEDPDRSPTRWRLKFCPF